MAIEITIPRLGWNMEEGIFAGWLKRDGEAVRAGEPLFSLEGDKATQDVEAIDPGVLRIPPDAPGVGDTVAVGAVIGYLAPAGRGRRPTARPRRRRQPRPRPSPPRRRPRRRPARPRTARRSTPAGPPDRARAGRRLDDAPGSGRGGRIRKVDVLEAASPPSPRPRRPRPGPIDPDRPGAADDRGADGREPADDGPRDADDHGRRDEPRQPPRAVQGRRPPGRERARATPTSSSS